jgi:hypothetical protein
MPVLKPGETFATGMVRPKTTALFFDKLWVHPALIKGFSSDELEPYRVPPEVCVSRPMHAADYYDSGERQRIYVASKWSVVAHTDVTEALRRLKMETWDLRSIFEIEAIQHFDEAKPEFWERLRERVPSFPFPSWEGDWELYMTTHQRNKAIAFIVRMYAERRIRLTPIYLTPSEYDEVTPQESAGLEVCLDHIPTVVDSEVTWEQVLEFRKDKRSMEMLDRLRRWFAMDLLEKSQDEIRNILGKRLDDYQWAIKKHGLRTVIAGTTSLISFVAGPAALQLLTASPLAAVLGGVTLASGIAAWVTNKLIEKTDIQRDEVAYIYEVRKLKPHIRTA